MSPRDDFNSARLMNQSMSNHHIGTKANFRGFSTRYPTTNINSKTKADFTQTVNALMINTDHISIMRANNHTTIQPSANAGGTMPTIMSPNVKSRKFKSRRQKRSE